ncbi:MAG: sugar ABC transporter permease [Spirochaetaceae bacterium]|nr:MAG: sugar ABC transporter permease [Spirochaetaceae bacterium]
MTNLRKTLQQRRRLAEVGQAYGFLSLYLIGLFAFILWPFGHSIYLAFTNYRFSPNYDYVGFTNFIRVFTDSLSLKSINVTTRYALVSVPLRLSAALLAAVVLNTGIRGIGIYRTVYYVPSLIGGGVAVAIMWRRIFGRRGLFNNFIAIFGLTGQDWIANPDTVRFMLVLLSVWQFGSSMLIFLAALKQVPKGLYESAEIDGAGSIRKFFRITVPLISPVILFNLVMNIIGAFQVFTQAAVITGGGPMNETMFMVLNIYNQAFRYGNMGYASALSWTLLVIIAGFTGISFLVSKYWVYYETSAK